MEGMKNFLSRFTGMSDLLLNGDGVLQGTVLGSLLLSVYIMI